MRSLIYKYFNQSKDIDKLYNACLNLISLTTTMNHDEYEVI